MIRFLHRIFVVYSSCIHLLDVVASQCGLPFHSYLTEVADDGSLLVGVEIQLPVVPEEIVLQRRFFWAYASASFPCPYNQAALQAVRLSLIITIRVC